MGTQRLGSNSSPGTTHFYYQASSGGFSLRAKGNSQTVPAGGIYVDQIYFWCGTHNGGSATFKFAAYTTGSTKLGETNQNFSYGTGYGFNHGNFTQGNYLFISGGTNVVGAVYTSGQGLQTAGYGGTGEFLEHSGTNFPSPWSTTEDKTDLGNAGWYFMYFPPATVTSIPTDPVFPGSTIEVDGLSFNAGIISVKVNGVACTGVSVTNDTTLTCVLPANATTGPVEVATYAGTATSSGDLTVSGGRIDLSGVLTATKGVHVNVGGVLVPVLSIRHAKADLTLEDAH